MKNTIFEERSAESRIYNEATGLPLLQFACRMLWDRRDRDRRQIRREAYTSLGGVAGALAEHADGVLEGMTPEEVSTARHMLLRLVTPEGTRRVLVASSVVEGLGQNAVDVLSRLIQSRLLSVRKGSSQEKSE